MSFSLLSLRIFWLQEQKNCIPTITSLLGVFFLKFWTKSGKFAIPPPKDRHCCSYPNREEGMQVDKQEQTHDEMWRSGVGRSAEPNSRMFFYFFYVHIILWQGVSLRSII